MGGWVRPTCRPWISVAVFSALIALFSSQAALSEHAERSRTGAPMPNKPELGSAGERLNANTIARFQSELGRMGYKFQFVTLAGFHSLNHAMFELACGYRDRGMAAYSELQQAEFACEAKGYTATRHQREVGTGYFDAVASAVSGGQASTVALKESTEAAQFKTNEAVAAECG